MALSHQHELHQRRRGRNMALAIVLVAFVAIVFGITFVKVTQTGFDASLMEQEG